MTTPINFVPNIESSALPATPAAEWADSTNGILGAHVTSTPLGTPGPRIPGAYPETPKGGDSTLLETAKGYMPAQADVQRAITNAGQTAKAYLPQGVASYFPSSEPTSDPNSLPRPAVQTDDSAATVSSTRAQAGSLHLPDSISVDTLTASDRPSKFTENMDTSPVIESDSPSPALSRASINPPLAAPSSEGAPGPQNSLATPPGLSNGDSDLKASSSGVAPQGSAALNSTAYKDNLPTGDIPEPVSGVPLSIAPTSNYGTQGSAALNSSAFKDNYPTGDAVPSPVTGVPLSTAPTSNYGTQGSAALNSSAPKDNYLTGDAPAASNPNATHPVTTPGSSMPTEPRSSASMEPTFTIQGSSAPPKSDTTTTAPSSHAKTGSTDSEDGAPGVSPKKSKFARLKEKMHVGHSSG